MKFVFADTYFYLALLNPRDAGHALACAASDEFVGEIATTEWILTEVGDALSRPGDRSRFLALVEMLQNDPDVQVVRSNPSLFQLGVERFRNRPDKDWPLTDCISFVVMEQQGITEALTADEHFEQAGFVALLKSPEQTGGRG